ncbi:hypothetical protein EJ08DRAFT_480999 [Tothia fuscella]|uniref:Uncharacterized protein n=1 Tax=Tothia fuscella TaxID=1048955 RepID=A0A9P4NI05_9PEZI|nr:hypothetical protein EJ08DRAFT_480999 [Tothia fuscella]
MLRRLLQQHNVMSRRPLRLEMPIVHHIKQTSTLETNQSLSSPSSIASSTCNSPLLPSSNLSSSNKSSLALSNPSPSSSSSPSLSSPSPSPSSIPSASMPSSPLMSSASLISPFALFSFFDAGSSPPSFPFRPFVPL